MSFSFNILDTQWLILFTCAIMKKLFFLLIAFVLFSSHDMFLKLDTYFLSPNTQASINLFNGTFDNSENIITRDRMTDVSLIGRGSRIQLDTNQWRDEDNTTILSFETGDPGTWVAGVSTRPRNLAMSAEDFNDYLEHDGVLDMLEWRKNNDALDQDAVEKYSKHVKTIFQVGNQLTDDWKTTLGYPIEFIPLSNPYDLHPGHVMELELLWQGNPLSNQLVYIGSQGITTEHSHEDGSVHDSNHEHSHDPENPQSDQEDHQHDNMMQARTDETGRLSVNITHKGIWHFRTIYLAHSEEAGLTHESNWATLTFEVGEGHSHAHEVGEHEHPEENLLGIPTYFYWIGSVVLVLALFFWFNRKNQ